jgi:uncharacterized protein YdaU (DUF1376 family)
MGKQPYIPLYIGDWEQDVNGLSIEAEGAWLKIIFKCWRNEGSFTATVEILARVCKVTPEKFATILLEWELGNICEITRHENGLITLASRRILRDCEISKERQISGAKGGAKRKQNLSKSEANIKQNPEYEYEYESDNEVKVVKERVQGKPLKDEIEEKLATALDELYIDGQLPKWSHIDFQFEYMTFCEKVRGSPEHYRNHDVGGIRLAFQKQLRDAKSKPKNGTTAKNDRSEFNNNELAIIAAHARKATGT